MKKIPISALFILLPHLSHTYIEDGIYVIPEKKPSSPKAGSFMHYAIASTKLF